MVSKASHGKQTTFLGALLASRPKEMAAERPKNAPKAAQEDSKQSDMQKASPHQDRGNKRQMKDASAPPGSKKQKIHNLLMNKAETELEPRGAKVSVAAARKKRADLPGPGQTNGRSKGGAEQLQNGEAPMKAKPLSKGKSGTEHVHNGKPAMKSKPVTKRKPTIEQAAVALSQQKPAPKPTANQRKRARRRALKLLQDRADPETKGDATETAIPEDNGPGVPDRTQEHSLHNLTAGIDALADGKGNKKAKRKGKAGSRQKSLQSLPVSTAAVQKSGQGGSP